MARFHQDPKFPKPQVRGRVTPLSETEDAARQRHEQLFNGLLAGTDSLPAGRTDSEAIPPYRQVNPRTGFYAALLAIRNIYASRKFDADDEARITAEAGSRELLGPSGAQIGRGYIDQQTALIQGSLSLQVRFIDQSDLGIASELSSALGNDKQAVFGWPALEGGTETDHWVGLDGINKRANGDIGFTGMDPASGRTIELSAGAVHQDLLKCALPLVVVEDYVPRLQPENPSLPPGAQSIFRPEGGDF